MMKLRKFVRRYVLAGAISFLLTLTIGLGFGLASSESVSVKAAGITELSATSSDNLQAIVTIETHIVDIGKPSDPVPEKPRTNCTYSRYPCSLVDRFDFSINGDPVFVARSVFADLSDINDASLVAENGTFILKLQCGDASEAYEVTITFNKSQVLERSVSAFGHISATTKYFPLL